MPVKKRMKKEKYGRSPLVESLLPCIKALNKAAKKTVQMMDRTPDSADKIAGTAYSIKDHKAVHAAIRDMFTFGTGMVLVVRKNGKKSVKHIPMDRPAPDFDEATCRGLDQVMLNPRRWFGEAKPRRKR